MNADQLLPETLALAVSLWIDEIRDWSPRARWSRARECGRLILDDGQHGAELLYGVGVKGQTATAFNRLAEAIACAAYQPGGIRAFGILWCAEHLGAPASTEGGQVCSGCVDVQDA
jgi:hypothetical protein